MMGTWETLKIIKKKCHGWDEPFRCLGVRLCFLSKSQQPRETNFPDHAPTVFIEQKLIFFYCILHINPILSFVLIWKNPSIIYKEWKQIENKSMSSFLGSRLQSRFDLTCQKYKFSFVWLSSSIRWFETKIRSAGCCLMEGLFYLP